jgi:hypothetical protein
LIAAKFFLWTNVLVRAQDCHNWNADKNNLKSEMSFQKGGKRIPQPENSPAQKLIKNQNGKNPQFRFV